jgi:hypothetical protein
VAPVARSDLAQGAQAVNLAIWLPTLFILGLMILGLLFAFVKACERV